MACTCTYIFSARNNSLCKNFISQFLDRRDMKASRLVVSITFDGNKSHTLITRCEKKNYTYNFRLKNYQLVSI